MIAVPTTTVTILSGSTTSEWGDESEGTTARATGVPAAIHEGAMKVQTESDPQARAVRFYTARLPNGTTLANNERLQDEATGVIYAVDAVTTPVNPALPQDVRVDLRRVT
ncbi:MAG TPA: hypothetical protein VFP10_12365 [Candidatus Eisenbacteria bacterium]|nr:hypothetical protein [Candidatus Eisenbacteria bacterium]